MAQLSGLPKNIQQEPEKAAEEGRPDRRCPNLPSRKLEEFVTFIVS